eukprot:1040474-Rhodomonas_salina.4
MDWAHYSNHTAVKAELAKSVNSPLAVRVVDAPVCLLCRRLPRPHTIHAPRGTRPPNSNSRFVSRSGLSLARSLSHMLPRVYASGRCVCVCGARHGAAVLDGGMRPDLELRKWAAEKERRSARREAGQTPPLIAGRHVDCNAAVFQHAFAPDLQRFPLCILSSTSSESRSPGSRWFSTATSSGSAWRCGRRSRSPALCCPRGGLGRRRPATGALDPGSDRARPLPPRAGAQARERARGPTALTVTAQLERGSAASSRWT